MRAKTSFVAVTTTLLLAFAVAPASATVTMTFHEKNATDTFTDVIPCLGDPPGALATITTTENGVLHITAADIDDQGTPDPDDDIPIPPLHVTGTFTGTFVAVPDDSSLPTFSGHFAMWFGENVNTKNDAATFTFTVVGHGSDGSSIKFHDTAHFSVTASGATVEFDKMNCR